MRERAAEAQKLYVADADAVEHVVDAVTGATWNTRNRIMADLFQEQLSETPDLLPAYRPPGC
ncbi:hypothetical protein [Adlercreutzia murintestinalis]|uniref:hypothetical protein n=1 Tax=Adlercreutzia murintestinalis TaxID=2941325 RepID=UPI002040676D|nr:hypothetical protein [Adlercreutzia murintestinalis]